MTTRHVGQSVGGTIPERGGDECQAAEDDYGEQHGRSAVAALALGAAAADGAVPGMVEVLVLVLVLLAAAPAME